MSLSKGGPGGSGPGRDGTGWPCIGAVDRAGQSPAKWTPRELSPRSAQDSLLWGQGLSSRAPSLEAAPTQPGGADRAPEAALAGGSCFLLQP